ncbi:MAG: hypothetical protein IJB85_07985 [Clostridia bacterium]|nr:hypothetical protein [Clostridia bacterium]
MFCMLGHIGPLANEAIAALPDEELAEYLRQHGYNEAKQAAVAAPLVRSKQEIDKC